MLLAVVDKPDRVVARRAAFGSVVAHVDMIRRAAIAVDQLESRPIRRQAGRDAQRGPFTPYPQQRFDDQPVHPAGRAGIPGPAAATRVRRDGVDVRGDRVGLHFVDGYGARGAGVVDRIDHAKELPGAIELAHLGEGHRRPDGRVRVLPAILAHAGDVALDVAGIQRGGVEWRLEELYQLALAAHEVLVQRLHGAARARGIARAG